MRAFVLCALFVGIAGCVEQPMAWHKQGVTEAEMQRDTYECERDTRMAAASFGTGPAASANAQAFAIRCMNARGYSLVNAAVSNNTFAPPIRDAKGAVYAPGAPVICRLPNGQQANMVARECVRNSGAVIDLAT